MLLLPLVILAGALFGAMWGLIPGWLLYKFNVSEILTTVLLNFISYQVIDFVATSAWRDPATGHRTTLPIGEGGFLPMLISNPPLHSGLILALAIAVGVYFYTNHTTAGYDLVATGADPRALPVSLGSMSALHSWFRWCLVA